MYQNGNASKAKVELKEGSWIIVYMLLYILKKYSIFNHRTVLFFVDTHVCAHT